MGAVSQEKFKVDHLRKRIAQVTVEYEDRLADEAVKVQVLLQQRDEAREHARVLADRVAELEAQYEPTEESDSQDEPNPE